MDQEEFGLITIEQLRGARGLLGWSQTELARKAGLSLPTVKRVEAGTGPRVSENARERLQRALESGGVEFIEENGGGPGVRLRKRRRLRRPRMCWGLCSAPPCRRGLGKLSSLKRLKRWLSFTLFAGTNRPSLKVVILLVTYS